jgi:hypothetical protein
MKIKGLKPSRKSTPIKPDRKVVVEMTAQQLAQMLVAMEDSTEITFDDWSKVDDAATFTALNKKPIDLVSTYDEIWEPLSRGEQVFV